MTTPLPDQTDIRRGAAVYSPTALRVYDLYVVWFNNRFVWRCPAGEILKLYNDNISGTHLDVGPGTGWYLDRAAFPRPDPELTLVDLNPNSLEKSGDRLLRYAPELVESDVFAPLPLQRSHDSIAANYLLHCLPGGWEAKNAAIGNIAANLSTGGVFFGSTVLGSGVRHGFLGRLTMKRFNETGIFHNEADDLEGLYDVLHTHFRSVTIKVVGAVALFVAKEPLDR